MCIREVHAYHCVLPTGGVEHMHKFNNLCASRSPCPDNLWEQRVTSFTYNCPSCTGRRETVPGRPQSWLTTRPRCKTVPNPLATKLDESAKWAWADEYVDDWAGFFDTLILASAKPATQMDKQERMETFLALALEGKCKEHEHTGLCGSEAPRTAAAETFLYNPASVVRERLARRVLEEWMEEKREEELFAGAWVGVEARNLHRERLEKHAPFRDGRARQPPMDKSQKQRRLQVLEKTLHYEYRRQTAYMRKNWFGEEADMILLWDGLTRRYKAVDLMARIMVEDVGISDGRLELVFSRMKRAVMGDAVMADAHGSKLARLVNRVTFTTNKAVQGTWDLGDENLEWLDGQKRGWLNKLAVYERLVVMFQMRTEVLPDGDEAVSKARGKACAMCTIDYFEERPSEEAKSRAQATTGEPATARSLVEEWADQEKGDSGDATQVQPWHFEEPANRFETGEAPVMIKKCGHVFGRRCLFQLWAKSGRAEPWCCPECDTPS